MTNLRTTHRWGLAVLVLGLGSLVLPTTSADAAPIKFSITDLGRVSGTGLDNDGNVIASPIRNIVGTLPPNYPTDSNTSSSYNEIIDGTADGQLLFRKIGPLNSVTSRSVNSYTYDPNAWNLGKQGMEHLVGMFQDSIKFSYGNDMNAQGAVVGWAVWGGVDASRPFYFGPGLLGLQDLNDLIPAGSGWKLEGALSINDRGQILGWGVNPEGVGSNFLLTPVDQVPEPATWAVFGLAAAAFAYRRRHAR